MRSAASSSTARASTPPSSRRGAWRAAGRPARPGFGDAGLADDDRLQRLLVRPDLGDADLVDDVLALRDLAEQRIVRRQPGVLAGDDEELAPRRARRLGLGLGHRDDALAVGEVLRRRLGDRVAGAAGAVPLGIAALDHEAGDDAVDAQPVVEALVGERLERAAGAWRASGVERDVELAAVGEHARDVRLALLELRGRLGDLDVLGLRRRHLLAAGRGSGRGRLGRGARLLLVAPARG